MQIPGDTGHPWRLNKFVEYQHKVPPIHPATICEYVKRKGLGKDDCVYLSWLISVTYCEVTALFLFETMPWRKLTPGKLKSYWGERKWELVFGSARKHVKNMDWFVPLLSSFMKKIQREPYKWVKSLEVKGDPVATYNNILKAIKTIKFTGRFAGDLFVEMLIHFSENGLIDLSLREPDKVDWKHCSNLTSGLLNIMYKDEEADEFDRSGRIHNIELLNKRILQVQKAIQRTYPEQDASIQKFITKICSFRNLFKSARYGGFHHDRQLGNIKQYEEWYPGYPLWKELYSIRKKLFQKDLLGEYGGWEGIRKERKKLWVTEGKTGVESLK